MNEYSYLWRRNQSRLHWQTAQMQIIRWAPDAGYDAGTFLFSKSLCEIVFLKMPIWIFWLESRRFWNWLEPDRSDGRPRRRLCHLVHLSRVSFHLQWFCFLLFFLLFLSFSLFFFFFFKINPTILFFYWTSSDGGRKREESPPETPPLATRPFRRYTSRPWPGLLTFPSHQRQAYVPRF